MMNKEINALNNKFNLLLLLFITILALIAAIAIHTYIDGSTLREVKSGSVKLYCDTGRGRLIINPIKIKAYIDGVFYFTNGYATSCELIR